MPEHRVLTFEWQASNTATAVVASLEDSQPCGILNAI